MDADPRRPSVRGVRLHRAVRPRRWRAGADLGDRQLFDYLRHRIHRSCAAPQEIRPRGWAGRGGRTEPLTNLSQSAASRGAAVRVLALGDAFETEQATNQATVRPTAP